MASRLVEAMFCQGIPVMKHLERFGATPYLYFKTSVTEAKCDLGSPPHLFGLYKLCLWGCKPLTGGDDMVGKGTQLLVD